MITQVKVFPRDFLDHCVAGTEKMPYPSWYLISIYSSMGKLGEGNNFDELLTPQNRYVLMQQGMKDCLSLQFDDLTYAEAKGLKERWPNDNKVKRIKLFSPQQAKQIISFLNKIKGEKEPSVLVVHCAAGISRSGAVGMIANDYLGLNHFTFIKDNPQVQPNFDVVAILKKAAGMSY